MGSKSINADENIIPVVDIQNMIFTIRGVQVMLDSDLAAVYEVETKMLNQAVKRNLERFPNSFRFQLTEKELAHLRSQTVTSSGHGGKRYLPYVFTEQGVSMLSAVLRSQTAVKVSIQIINAFVEMRKFIQHNVNLFARLDSVERHQVAFEFETEKMTELSGALYEQMREFIKLDEVIRKKLEGVGYGE